MKNRGGRVVRWCWVKLPVPGRPTICITVGQGPPALAVGAGGGCLDIFTLIYHFSFSPLSLPLYWRWPDIQSTLIISTSVISNNRLSRKENLILVLT